MARSFAVTMKDGSTIPMQDGSTIAKDPIRADAKGHAEVVFKVTNNTARPARALAKVVPLGETKREWLSINGEDERDFAPRGDQEFTVSFDAPASPPAGAKPAGGTVPTAGAPATPEVHKYPFRFDVASPLDPQEDFTQGPVVTVEVMPTTVVKPKSKLWILFVVLGVVLLIGIIALVLYFWNGDTGTDGDESPTPTPVESPETPTPTTQLENEFSVTNHPIAHFAIWATTPNVKPLVGDFNADGRTDVALTGPAGWGSLPVAFSNGDGTFNVTNQPISNFAIWAATPNAHPLVGDFNGDGRADVALTGPTGWGSLPVAFSNGDGNFIVTNQPIAHFALWAASPNAKPLVGDFNNDRRTDVALTGPTGWGSLPVAFSNGDGNFTVTNHPISEFAIWAAIHSAKPLVGDFNLDGRIDVALTGPSGWASLPVAFSNGDGTFHIANQPLANFAIWAAAPNAKPLVGDFNGDRRTDVALTGPSGWSSLPVAFSTGDGTFNVTNHPISEFAVFAAAPNAKPLVGDFNGDGRTDIALTGPSGWSSLPVAFSKGDGNFTVTNKPIANFANWAATPNAQPLVGDFNNDRRTDVALTGPFGWGSLPVAFSQSPE